MKMDYFINRATNWDTPRRISMANHFVNALLEHVEPKSHWKGMEIGAGTGLVGLQLLQKVKSMVFVDTSVKMLDVLKKKIKGVKNVEIVSSEVADYQVRDIDFVFSNMSFHHIEDIPATLEHVYKITQPNAVMVIGDLRSEDGSFHQFDPVPHRGFDTDELSEWVENAGFSVKSVNTYNVLKRERIQGKISEYEQFILVAERK